MEEIRIDVTKQSPEELALAVAVGNPARVIKYLEKNKFEE